MSSHVRTVCRISRTGCEAARWRGSQPRLSRSLKAKVCLSIPLSIRTSPGRRGNETTTHEGFWAKESRTLGSWGNILHNVPAYLWDVYLSAANGRRRYFLSSSPCSMAARTFRFSSVAAPKLTAGVEEAVSWFDHINTCSWRVDVASKPCCRFQKGILAGVLNTELDDVVTELLFSIFFMSVHHSAGRTPTIKKDSY